MVIMSWQTWFVTTSHLKTYVFWDITPCTPVKVNRLAASLILVSCLAWSSTLKMEAACSSETSLWEPQILQLENWLVKRALINILLNGTTRICATSQIILHIKTYKSQVSKIWTFIKMSISDSLWYLSPFNRNYIFFTDATTLCGSWPPPRFRNSKFFLGGVVSPTPNP
jgi:hypothetical protein